MASEDRQGIRPITIGLWITAAAGLIVVLAGRWLGPPWFYVTEREWQTAITAWWMKADHLGVFDAVTPLMGPPWRIPMEFPLFQWLAAHATTPWLSLEDTGRALSLVFFLVTIWVLRSMALDLDLDRPVADGLTLIVASSPLFLLYAFSFTIESLALLLALTHLWLFIKWLRRPSLVLLIASISVGGLAALTKVTTWTVAAAAVLVIGFWSILAARRIGRSIGDVIIGLVLVVGIPLAVGAWWTHWSDTVKSANALTAGLTSGALQQWNFGTLGQRLNPAAWGRYALRSTVMVFGPVGTLAFIPAVVLFFKYRRSRPPVPVWNASLAAVAVGPLVFTNLHFVHDYYALATGAFAGILLAGALFGRRFRPWVAALIVVTNLGMTGMLIAAKQANYADPLTDGLAAALENLPEDQTLIVVGSYLDARLPYRTGRKALQTRVLDPDDPAFLSVLDSMGDQQVGAIVTRSAADDRVARRAVARLGLNRRFDPAAGVTIWTSPANAPRIRRGTFDLQKEKKHRLAGFTETEPIGRFGLFRPTGEDAAPGLGWRRNGNLYLFDLQRGFRVIHRRWSPTGRASVEYRN